MKLYRIFAHITIALALALNASFSSAKDWEIPSAKEMQEYLRENAETRYSCRYTRKHFIDLDAGLHRIVAIAEGVDEMRDFTPDERQFLVDLIREFPALQLLRAERMQIVFESRDTATNPELLAVMYLIKKEITRRNGDLFLKSTATCPGGVSVGND